MALVFHDSNSPQALFLYYLNARTGQILSWKYQLGCHPSSTAPKSCIIQPRGLLRKLVVLISRILMYSWEFNLISNAVHAPRSVFFYTEYHRNGYEEICILLLNLLLAYIVSYLCLDFPTCTKGSVMLLCCVLVLRGRFFEIMVLAIFYLIWVCLGSKIYVSCNMPGA